MHKCNICLLEMTQRLMCKRCSRSYWRHRLTADDTIIADMTWAANRARRTAKKEKR